MSAGHLLGGRYQVGELLGYGGMAEVHRGRDLRLGRDVAIKMLRTDLARDATFQMRFRREAQNAAALNHPAIVAVYDTGEETAPTGETLPYIVMEFVNGRTLKEVLGAEGRLMPRRALEITADICAALEFSHRHGIIHRDIKPGNVMLTQTGQVKVMDFGIARALASGASTMTQTSAVIGTAQYLSPEQARGETVDARSDVYATGCVLYELLTGHPPFVGDNPVSVAYQHVREDPLPPSDSNRDVPPEVDAVVLKALAKNRVNRYQSAGEMRGDLLRAANGRPVLATPVMRMDSQPTMPVQQPRAAGNRPTGTMSRAGAPGGGRQRGTTWIWVTLGLLGLLAVAALATGLFLQSKSSMVTVPNLYGLTKDQADTALASRRLTGNSQTVNDPQCSKDKVFKQSPDAGRKVAEQTAVSYSICGGPGAVQVPPVVGQSQNDAVSALQAAGLNPQVNQVDGLVKDQNKVIAASPAPGTSVQKGSTVVIQISKGNQVVVPDLTGYTQSMARQKLLDLGFAADNISVVPNNNPGPGQAGKVTGQIPSANKTAKLSDTVTIIVGANNNTQQPNSPTPTSSPST